MGVPEHFSRDIVMRCQSLIQHLWPRVSAGLPNDREFGGPLRTTFLLALATPMIVLPVERLFKPTNGDTAADDRQLDERLAKRVVHVFGPRIKFKDTPFWKNGIWSYVPNFAPFNIALPWPDELLARLALNDSIDAAANAMASRILIDLRNALAHGGVAYLNKDGTNAYGEAAQLAFVAAKQDRSGNVTALKILRIGESEFLAFLEGWANWVARSPLASALESEGAFAA